MDIKQIILTRVQNLPTLPTIYSSLTEAMASPMATADGIAEIISTDQAASFKILKVANSALYGFRSKIDTVSKAISSLGFNEVKNLVLGLSVINLFSKNKSISNFSPMEFWGHSIAVGVATRTLANIAGVKNLDNFFSAGILHDIGKLLFLEYFDKEFAKALEYSAENKCLIKDSEKKMIGLDHSIAGNILADKWQLPNTIKGAISYHHIGVIPGEKNMIVSAVHLADIFVRMLNLGNPGDDWVPQPNQQALDLLNLPKDAFSSISNSVIRDYEESMNAILTA